MRLQVESQRVDLLARARAEADAMVGEAAGAVEVLRRQAEDLRYSLSARRQELVAFLQSALDRLEGVEAVPAAVGSSPPGWRRRRQRLSRPADSAAPADSADRAGRRAPGTAPHRIAAPDPAGLRSRFRADHRSG